MLKILRVEGYSMAPRLLEGDYVLIHTFFNIAKFKSGDWLVFDHPGFGLLLKEYSSIDTKKHTFRCRSINPKGLTENEMGNIPLSRVMGKVFRHIPYEYKKTGKKSS